MIPPPPSPFLFGGRADTWSYNTEENGWNGQMLMTAFFFFFF
jgi:hypothetical protein